MYERIKNFLINLLGLIAGVIVALIVVALILTLCSWLTQLLWNWLMPVIFGLVEITFWQALGLIVLIRVLFSRDSQLTVIKKTTSRFFKKE